MKKIRSSATLKRLLVIAFPMVISQTSDTLMLFVDRFFLSRVGEEYLAASMSGGLTQFMLGSFFIGTIGYVTAVVAQYYGAGRHEKCAEATFQAVVFSSLPSGRRLYRLILRIPIFRPSFSAYFF